MNRFRIAALIGVAWMAIEPARAQSLQLDERSYVQGQAIVMPGYQYAASVTWIGSGYRMHYCSGIAGDYIVKSNSVTPSAAGPWTNPTISLAPTRKRSDFDGQHVCDPSVIIVKNRSYLYYGGYPLEGGGALPTTCIGVAVSDASGSTFSRPNRGPIIKPRNPNLIANPGRRYGAGQPTAVYVDPWIYLGYSDSTGTASNPINGGGFYVIRSKDPLFQGKVEELTASGFVPRASTASITTEYKLMEAYSADLQYCDLISGFLLAVNGLPGVTTIFAFDGAFRNPRRTDIPRIDWAEGPAVTRRLDGHSLAHAVAPSSRIPVILFYPTGDPRDPFTWDISFTGVDLIRP